MELVTAAITSLPPGRRETCSPYGGSERRQLTLDVEAARERPEKSRHPAIIAAVPACSTVPT